MKLPKVPKDYPFPFYLVMDDDGHVWFHIRDESGRVWGVKLEKVEMEEEHT